MNLVGISLNHKTSPLELREALHLSSNEIIDLIKILKESICKEGFIISTCNRTEIYGIANDEKLISEHLIEALLKFKPIEGIKTEYFSKYFSCGAIKHLFSVASGIDSLIIGDGQILGQVKEAFDISSDLNFSGSVLKRLFDTTVKVGRRAIKETSIGEGAVTVSYAAVQVVEKIFSNLEKKSALIIGAGETGELAAIHLRDKGISKLTISNRTEGRAKSLAEKVGGTILDFSELKQNLHQFDIVISATSAENYILEYEDFKLASKQRRGLPQVIMDIAVPRDINPKVNDLDGVFYHDMDALKSVVDHNLQKRKDQVPIVEKLIMEEMVGFFAWYNALGIVPTIKSIKVFFEEIRNDELMKIKNKISNDDFNKIDDMTKRMVGRLLHNPIKNLRSYAELGNNTTDTLNITSTIKELFSLDDGLVTDSSLEKIKNAIEDDNEKR